MINGQSCSGDCCQNIERTCTPSAKDAFVPVPLVLVLPEAGVRWVWRCAGLMSQFVGLPLIRFIICILSTCRRLLFGVVGRVPCHFESGMVC